MFQRLSRTPNSAFSAAMRMSASRAVSRPAAKAYPLTAAMTGLKMSTLRVYPQTPGVSQLAQLGSGLQVPAGAEGGLAGTGDDQHEGVVVVSEVLPGVVQLCIHRPVDGVVLMGTVVGQRDDVVFLLVDESLVLHGVLLLPGWRGRSPPYVIRQSSVRRSPGAARLLGLEPIS
jgi:hypothetical protein